MPPKRGRAKDTSFTLSPRDIRAHLVSADPRVRMSLRSESGGSAMPEQNISDNETSVDEREEQITLESLTKMVKEGFDGIDRSMKDIESKLEVTANLLENRLEALTARVEVVGGNYATLTEKVDTLEKEVVDNTKVTTATVTENSGMIQILHDTIKDLQTQINVLVSKDEAKEQHGRKMNLWLYGVAEDKKGENTWEVFFAFCQEILGFSPEAMEPWLIRNIHRVGNPKNADRPIIIAFVSWPDRQTVLKAGAMLSRYNRENNTTLAIRTDLAPIARYRRKILHGVSKLMKEKEKVHVRVCDNPKGVVWLERRKNETEKWDKVKEFDREYLPTDCKDFEY